MDALCLQNLVLAYNSLNHQVKPSLYLCEIWYINNEIYTITPLLFSLHAYRQDLHKYQCLALHYQCYKLPTN